MTPAVKWVLFSLLTLGIGRWIWRNILTPEHRQMVKTGLGTLLTGLVLAIGKMITDIIRKAVEAKLQASFSLSLS